MEQGRAMIGVDPGPDESRAVLGVWEANQELWRLQGLVRGLRAQNAALMARLRGEPAAVVASSREQMLAGLKQAGLRSEEGEGA